MVYHPTGVFPIQPGTIAQYDGNQILFLHNLKFYNSSLTVAKQNPV
jgi:hypothetical protein